MSETVSREIEADLATFAALVRKWSPHINLISASTTHEIESRHIADCLQLRNAAPKDAKTWLDLGSGGGFPGLVIAIVAKTHDTGLHVTLVESDQRKAVFLREATRLLSLNTTVRAQRIESLKPQQYDVVSARALAPLPKLLPMVAPFLNLGGVGLFPKGANLNAELTEARKDWHITFDRVASETDPEATILVVRELSRVG